MVTQSAAIMDSHFLLAGEPPPPPSFENRDVCPGNNKKRILNKDVSLKVRTFVLYHIFNHRNQGLIYSIGAQDARLGVNNTARSFSTFSFDLNFLIFFLPSFLVSQRFLQLRV